MCSEIKRLEQLSKCMHLNKTDRDAIKWALERIQPSTEVAHGKAEEVGNVEGAFEYFWKYSGMAKANKSGARKAFRAAFKKACDTERLNNRQPGTPAQFAEYILKDAQQRLKNKQYGFDSLHVQTYLNGARWEDETVQSTNSQQGRRLTKDEERADELLGLYGNPSACNQRPANSVTNTCLDQREIQRGLPIMEQEGVTIDVDSGYIGS